MPSFPSISASPPINTAKYRYFALVKDRPGLAGGTDDTHYLVGASEDDLRSKVALLPSTKVAYYRSDIAEFKKAEGTYNFNRNFTSLKTKSDLGRAGLLTGQVPEFRADNLVNDLVNFHRNQETQLLRDYVELHNAKFFDQVQAMGQRYVASANSFFGNEALGDTGKLAPGNPYASYIRTMFGVSSKDVYPTWSQAQEKLQSYFDGAYNAIAESFGALRKGIITPEEAEKVSNSFGIGNFYGNAMSALTKAQYYGGLSNRLPAPNIFNKIVATANTILGKTIIRMDPLQQLVHAVTLPIMSQLEYGGATKELSALLSSQVPGSNLTVPSFSRTMFNAIRAFATRESNPDPAYQAIANSLAMPRDQLALHQKMINELTIPSGPTSNSQWLEKLDKAGAFAEKISGTNFVNEFNHFVASHIGYQIGSAAGQTGQELADTVSTFTNRVLANVTAGQRGAIFHGPIGQALGLFQSYQFNLMQQVFRHIEQGNVKTLALSAGLQSTVFGASSLPGFSALNDLIQKHDGNVDKDNLESLVARAIGPKAADYLLYGALSGLTGSSLYTRGDINPRGIPVVSKLLNPLEIPSVSLGIKTYNNIAQLGSNIAKGGAAVPSIMYALEHNGLSRPLTGLVQMMQGYSTDNKGNLISAIGKNSANGYSDLYSVANFMRLLGSRPLDESIGLKTLYDQNAAKVAENIRLEQIGQAFKTQLYGQQTVDPAVVSRFASEYAANGGDITNFNKTMMRWTNDANTSVVNRVFNHLGSSPSAKTAMVVMGGQKLNDFSGAPQ